jgi:hypothetical protein
MHSIPSQRGSPEIRKHCQPFGDLGLDQAREFLKRRLAELDDERKRLEQALVELGEKAIGRPRRGRGRPRASGKRARKAGRRPGRRKNSGAEQAVQVLKPAGPTYCRSTSALKLRRASSRLLALMRFTTSASAILPNTLPGSA